MKAVREDAAGRAEVRGTLGVLTHLSHEIRTPLNSMLALSQLLRDGLAGKLNSEQQSYIEVIERNGQNLIRLVNDVLDMSRLESGHVDIQIRSLDIGEQLSATATALMPLARAKGIELGLDPLNNLPPVRCDPDRVRQVLTNLIGNAIKFTDHGRVTLGAEPLQGKVAVYVSDTGVGIPEAARPRVFDEFFQAASLAAERKNEGTGLGLAIASRLVHLMGGELSVESAEGVGSRFTFTLPRADRPPCRHTGDADEVETDTAAADPVAEGGTAEAHRFQDEAHGTNSAGR